MLPKSPVAVVAQGTDQPSAAQQTSAPHDPPVDLGSLLPLFEGNPAFQKQLIETFLTHSEATLAAMRHALSTADPAALRHAAHSLKGAAAEMGADPLRRAAAAMETHARQGRADSTVAPLVKAMESELARVAEILRATLP